METQAPPDIARRNVELDFVRGIAILLVMVSHADLYSRPDQVPAEALWAIKRIGWSGVELFFVLSGFLVGGLLVREYAKTGAVNARRFLLRRGFKIWPPYYAFLLVQIIGRKHPLYTFAVPNLLHLQNYLGTSISHTWTLSLEEHFYILLSFSFMWMASRRASARTLMASISIVCAAVFVVRTITALHGNIDGAINYTHCRLDGLLFGVALAVLRELRPRIFEALGRRKWPLILVSLAGFAVLFTIEKPSLNMLTWGFEVVYAGYAALLLLIYFHFQRFRRTFWVRGIAYLGLYSYGIYLWHNATRPPVRYLVGHLPGTLQFPVGIALEATCMVAIGVVATRLIEWPMLRIRERIAGNPERRVATPVRHSNSPAAVELTAVVQLTGKEAV
jgi:peptidoglycan/LPS O-acetylase OafA/YrhL